MSKTESESESEYIAAEPESMHHTVDRLRSAIRKAVPKVQEVISYKMPTYTLQGNRLLYFAAASRPVD